METAASNWVKDTIVLCPTSDQEWLPMHPDYPADIFTSCLTTPIQIALRWFVRRNRQSMGGLNPEAVDAIPGKPNDRKTPLGELNWIFTAVTDSIAWNVLPKALFQRLFRQDLLVASMFRNFLLADRILRSLNCTPQSYPPLPPGVADHPMWQAWDLACETCLAGLLKDGILGNHVVKSVTTPTPTTTTTTSLDGTETVTSSPMIAPPPESTTSPPLPEAPMTGPASSVSSPFFSEQLTAFEIWLEFASIHKATLEGWEGDEDPPLESPEQLPVVLQVLLSQVHRIRALLLLRRFLDLGPWAVNLSLSLGIFPYVMKLLQSPEYKSLLVSIWASILKFDPSCQIDLVKDGALPHFIQPLTTWNVSHNKLAADAAKQRTLSAFSLAATCYNYPTAQTECLRQNLHGHCCALLSSFAKFGERGGSHDPDPNHNHQPHLAHYEQDQAENAQKHLPPTARLWLCICLGNLVKNNLPAQHEAYNSNVHRCLASRFQDKSPSVRAAVCYALACLLEHTPRRIPVAPNAGGGDMMPQTPTPQNMASPIYTPNSPGATPFSPLAQVLVPQHMSATTMTVPAALTASAVLSGQLRPAMGNQPPNDGMGNPMWHPQGQPQGQHQVLGSPQVHVVQQGHPQGSPQPRSSQQQPLDPRMVAPPNAGQPGIRMGPPGQPMMSPGGAPLLHQQHLLRPQHGQPMTAHMMGSPHGRTVVMNAMSPHHSHGTPGGGTPHLMTQMIPPPVSPENMSRRRPSVFDDRRRVELDLSVVEILLNALNDGSTVVRYEGMMALGCAIGKYLAAYLVVAEEMSTSTSSPPTAEENESEEQPARSNIVPIPRGVNRSMLDRFAASWKAIRSVQHKDTHPNIARAANVIVSVVHEQLLDLRVEIEMRASEEANMASDALAGIQEEGGGVGGGGVDIERTFSERLLVHSPEPDGPRRQIQSDGPLHRLPFRRTASDLGTPVGWQSNADDPRNAMQLSQGTFDALELTNQHRKEYSLPKSKFYEWKTETFQSSYDSSEDDFLLERDPLCPSGAAHAYQRRRNMAVREAGRKLAQRFVALAPKPPKRKQGLDMMLEDDDEADEKDLSLKGDLKLREKKVLRNTGVEMTSMLKFHAYEDVLMVCDNQGGISVWDYDKGNRCSVYQNCNPKGSRMTTAFWIDESSSSLFFVGCDDGSARIWDGIVESNGEISREPPTLASAFFADPDITAGQRGGSGLICEWQQFSGTLLAGGSSKHIRCWDLAAEQCGTLIETNSEACVTTLTTAWDSDHGAMSAGYQGMGPDIIVAGHGDGTLKLFDIRAPQNAAAAVSPGKKSRGRPTKFTEHSSWIVDTSFTCYGGRFEIISGSVAGDIRAWDLRASSSLRTLDVQRSPMTALTVHKQIPIAATGSHAQFIKILTLEGETLQVARFHEEMSGHRIGPVSCLEFHKHKLLLAAGATNSLVSIYEPKHKPLR
jgi:WD40 repeat protein